MVGDRGDVYGVAGGDTSLEFRVYGGGKWENRTQPCYVLSERGGTGVHHTNDYNKKSIEKETNNWRERGRKK